MRVVPGEAPARCQKPRQPLKLSPTTPQVSASPWPRSAFGSSARSLGVSRSVSSFSAADDTFDNTRQSRSGPTCPPPCRSTFLVSARVLPSISVTASGAGAEESAASQRCWTRRGENCPPPTPPRLPPPVLSRHPPPSPPLLSASNTRWQKCPDPRTRLCVCCFSSSSYFPFVCVTGTHGFQSGIKPGRRPPEDGRLMWPISSDYSCVGGWACEERWHAGAIWPPWAGPTRLFASVCVSSIKRLPLSSARPPL